MDNSSWIWDPGTSFKALGPRVLRRMNVLSGCDLWKAIWCGENRTLLPLATFNSTVKKCLEVLYPNRSGMPSKLRFSTRFQMMEHVFFLRSWYNFRSGATAFFKVTFAYESSLVGAIILRSFMGFKTTLIEFAPMIVLS
mgnify:CR=1 FL=1